MDVFGLIAVAGYGALGAGVGLSLSASLGPRSIAVAALAAVVVHLLLKSMVRKRTSGDA